MAYLYLPGGGGVFALGDYKLIMDGVNESRIYAIMQKHR